MVERYFKLIEGQDDYRRALVVGIPEGFILEGIRNKGDITVTRGIGGPTIHSGNAIEIVVRREKELE